MSQRLIQQTLKLFEDQEKAGQPPSLAILGPPGSGKSLFVNQLLSTFRNDPACVNKHSLIVDLRKLMVGSQADTYFYVNNALLQEAKTIGISLDFDIKIQPPHLRFEEILRNLLRAVQGYLVIFIDHLESVPRVFASDLSHRFRNFLETTEVDSDYSRLGLIICGAVSLFDLKHGPNSAFQMLPVMLFPQQDADTQKELVEEYLKSYMTTEIGPELITCLAELTGGEPGFLEPLMLNLLKSNRQITLDEKLLAISVQEICSHSQVPALRNLALHLHGDNGLRNIVRELKASRAVMPRSVVPDIDRYQLSGAVVVRRGPSGQAPEYQFRNRITAAFLSELYDLLESNDYEAHPNTPLWADLKKIEAARSDCINAGQIWTWMNLLQEAWKLTTGYEIPNLKLYVTKRSGDGWWFDADAKSISGPETRPPDHTSMMKAAQAALQNASLALTPDSETFRAFVETDTDHISLSIPLYARELSIVLCVTLLKGDAGRGITEFDVWHWIRFVQNVKHVVPTLTLTLAELGQKMLRQSPAATQQTTKATAQEPIRQIFLIPQGNAIVKEANGVWHISGSFDPKDFENLNGRCLKLVNQWTTLKEFEAEIHAIAHDLDTALKARFPTLAPRLTPADRPVPVLITSDVEGLKLPLELFPHSSSHLALLTGVSRQILGYSLRPQVSASFDYLLKSLVEQRRELRVLLMASYVGNADTDEAQELKRVRSHIEAGCRQLNLSVRVVEMGPEDATVANVEMELTENGPYHLVHYCGHGRHFREGQDLSGIVLSGEDGELEVVTCKQLRAWFTAAESWLVYLSCCNSSASSGRLGLSERYIGMIDAIALAGVPNIVGFRCMVSDEGALHLAAEFYRQLFEVQKQKDLSLAMWNARKRVGSRPDFFDAWASSMLITQYP